MSITYFLSPRICISLICKSSEFNPVNLRHKKKNEKRKELTHFTLLLLSSANRAIAIPLLSRRRIFAKIFGKVTTKGKIMRRKTRWRPSVYSRAQRIIIPLLPLPALLLRGNEKDGRGGGGRKGERKKSIDGESNEQGGDPDGSDVSSSYFAMIKISPRRERRDTTGGGRGVRGGGVGGGEARDAEAGGREVGGRR